MYNVELFVICVYCLISDELYHLPTCFSLSPIQSGW